MNDEWREVLEKRSTRDKIAVAIDCDLAPVGQLNTVAELVREGIIVWLDRAVLGRIGVVKDQEIIRRGVNCDIYLLTPKGVALCEQEGIKQQ